MDKSQEEYYRAVGQHTAILIDLQSAQKKLNKLRIIRPVSDSRVIALERRVGVLKRMALASQRVVALKEEALLR